MDIKFTRKIGLVMLSLFLALGFTVSANNDSPVYNLLGSYKGVLDINLMGVSLSSVDTIYIESSKQENSVKFSLLDFTLGSGSIVIPVGDIVLDSIKVTPYEGVDSFENKVINLTLAQLGGVEAKIDFGGAVKGDSVFVDLSVSTDMEGTPLVIPVTFKGEKYQGPVANEEFAATTTIWALDGKILVNTEKPGTAHVYSVLGQLVRQVVIGEGQTTIPVRKGIYIVRLSDGTTRKVLVK